MVSHSIEYYRQLEALKEAEEAATQSVDDVVSKGSTVLSRQERLAEFAKRLKEASPPTNPDEAIQMINRHLDDVEDLYSGVVKNSNAALLNRSDGGMYSILDDTYVTRHANGSVTALTKGHRIEIQPEGSFSIFVRKTGELFLKK